jgi:hypothetical protein
MRQPKGPVGNVKENPNQKLVQQYQEAFDLTRKLEEPEEKPRQATEEDEDREQ